MDGCVESFKQIECGKIAIDLGNELAILKLTEFAFLYPNIFIIYSV